MFVHSDTKVCRLSVPMKIHLLHPPRSNSNGVFGKPYVLFWNETCYVADKFEPSKWEKANEFATGVKEPKNNNESQGNGFKWKQSVLTQNKLLLMMNHFTHEVMNHFYSISQIVFGSEIRTQAIEVCELGIRQAFCQISGTIGNSYK